jgi:hypothetical protein
VEALAGDRQLTMVSPPDTNESTESDDGKWLVYAQLDHVSSDIKLHAARD